MIDKDLKEDASITQHFPDARVLYCNWHNDQTFQKKFKNKSFECVQEMMLAENEDRFNAKLSEFEKLGKIYLSLCTIACKF